MPSPLYTNKLITACDNNINCELSTRKARYVIVDDECHNWNNGGRLFRMLIWETKKETLYSNGLLFDAIQTNPTLEYVANPTLEYVANASNAVSVDYK